MDAELEFILRGSKIKVITREGQPITLGIRPHLMVASPAIASPAVPSRF